MNDNWNPNWYTDFLATDEGKQSIAVDEKLAPHMMDEQGFLGSSI